MRICIVFDCLFPLTVGGAERWYRNLAERLGAEGHEVTYLTLRQWPARQGPPQIGTGVRVVAVAPPMELYVHGRRRIAPALRFGLGVALHLLRHGGRYQVVHTNATPFFGVLAAGLLQPLRRYRLVVDWHELWTLDYWRDYLGTVRGSIAYAIQTLCARLPQQAYCFARLTERRLHAAGVRGPVRVLEGEYAGSLQPPEPQPARPIVLFAGRLIPEKRPELAIAGFALAARRLPDLTLLLLGEGPQRERVERAIAAHGLGERVHAPGFVASEEVEQAMRAALVMLSTSSREGYGMVVVEAAAHGTPALVIAGEDNAAVELIAEGQNGYVIGAAQPELVAEAIMRVHREGMALRESTARWFAENAQRLSLEHSLQDVLAAYRA